MISTSMLSQEVDVAEKPPNQRMNMDRKPVPLPSAGARELMLEAKT